MGLYQTVREDRVKYDADNPLISGQQASIDWIYRYEPVLDFLLENQLTRSRILDYGCGNVGLGSVFAGEYFGIDLMPIQPEVPNLKPINGVHPFALQDSFDVVCAMDVMEHVPVDLREDFFVAMRRIARRYLILAFPTEGAGYQFDVETATFLNPGGTLPDWLLEHMAMDHPRVEAILDLANKHGFQLINHVKNTHRLMHYLGCMGLFVGGRMKLRFLNDIHHINRLHQAETSLDMYRSILFLRANG
ncbi:methyltransferase domain-containing protein [Dyella nitratireducens]|uniref:methyltransferase domain-containing protein n=1 Tax=Dyella nitratireducens TaxID=1849580 RepID=UPI00166DD9B3|nr:methyltransferase domain-containing protein [Dyella nitratireducens]